MVMTRQEKQESIQELKRKLQQYSVAAVASVQNLPAKHYNRIRKNLRGHAEVFMTREALMRRALEEAKPELKVLEQYMQGSCILLLSNENPFQLAKLLRKSTSKAFAKAGQVAPFDLIVPEGETNFSPGPVLTELKQAGIDAKIKGPKVVIGKPSTVAKKGAVISQQAAAILMKMGIEPVEVGMKIRAAYDAGVLYKEDALDITEEQWISDLQKAHQQALNLSVFAGIMNKYSVEVMIQKAARQANALSKVIEAKQGTAKSDKPTEPATAPAGASPAAEQPAA